ncbi:MULTISPECIES: thioredoxin family protein [Xanthomonas]|uniref:Thiol reductase thioredoxin n=1 Tax=Xanthomonas cucurbitae TaxID=56453 RepID=A0A2S7DX94_9XANT|nr:thioredoxin family protein [Xanthomonas cucurbitae]PPU78464.1 thiol reductase thioredoxin [Xanthomonas cucurbitae]QHG88731.1 thioredoxin family protein [Xanthomonas cucurbitae]WDM67854.1 thioredoxin family protein [Xanthomonas cucurbitae]WDM71728.1 thioredoxin family protein [Xanthomonas cucurbitae]WDM75321.1 thioredoxin family protein [Xanthomonas cucurbitae]
MRTWLLFCLLAVAPLAQALDLPYDEHANADAQLRAALAAGKKAHKPTLVIFGANWCHDCRALDAALHTARNAPLIDKSFVVVKVDVGNFDRNLALSQRYGDPIQKGIPAAVVISPTGTLVYTTRAGELANARKMSDDGIYQFFDHVAHANHAP